MKSNVKTNASTQKRRDIVFFSTILFWPIVTFLLLYVYVNFNMIMLAFKEFNPEDNRFYFEGFTNFKLFFKDLTTDDTMKLSAINSIITFLLHLVIGMPVSIMVSFAVYKNIHFSGFFRVVLFLPSIISSIVWVLIFKYAVEYALPAILQIDDYVSLLVKPGSIFKTMLFYYLWLGVPGNFILYTGAMTRVPTTLVEYGKLDGLKGLKELWYLTIPLIFPTISVFLVTSVAGIFTNQLNLYAFFGQGASSEAYTFGYYFFKIIFGNNASFYSQYPYAAAAGIVFTLIVAPMTMLLRYLLEKFGPTVEY